MKNIFISHHHKDDASVDGLTTLLKGKEYDIRNSSIRVRPENKDRIEKNQINENVLKRLLRMKMRWASQLVVIIGKETHQRYWVNWEIEAAHQLGKPIVGVYEIGLKDKVEIPENLKKYATSLVGWRSDSIIRAIEGDSIFEKPDGEAFSGRQGGNIVC